MTKRTQRDTKPPHNELTFVTPFFAPKGVSSFHDDTARRPSDTTATSTNATSTVNTDFLAVCRSMLHGGVRTIPGLTGTRDELAPTAPLRGVGASPDAQVESEMHTSHRRAASPDIDPTITHEAARNLLVLSSGTGDSNYSASTLTTDAEYAALETVYDYCAPTDITSSDVMEKPVLSECAILCMAAAQRRASPLAMGFKLVPTSKQYHGKVSRT